MSNISPSLTAALADRYRIEGELGQGGMATVYLAQDLKHDRKVAIKVLRPELAAMLGAERFLAEIKVTANLQHPHILPLHDSGEAEGFLYYVMPFIEGESLRDRLTREKQLPVSDALRIAREAAGALDYAHRHGIIHRDIKPENILLHEGQALVGDFGIALAVRAAGGNRLTETGLSLGTPYYMSPEQAMGERDLNPRSDIYSLGSVVYEMLVGEPPFSGANAQAIVAKVLTERAHAIRPIRSTVPRHVEEAVLRALEKLPADRWGTAAEFAQALEAGPSDSRAHASTNTEARPAEPRPMVVSGPQRARSVLPWMLSGALAIAAAFFAFRGRATFATSPITQPATFALDLPKTDVLRDEPILAMSPDGSQLVVSATREGKDELLSRHMDRMGFDVLAGTDDGSRPFFSPDGRWVGFTAHGKLRKIPAEGGAVVTLADATWGGGTWGPDGTIVYTPTYKSGLWRLPPNGASPEAVTRPDSTRNELAHFWPRYMPDGRHVIFTSYSTPIETSRIEVVDLKTGARRVLVENAAFGRYVPTGQLLFVRGGTVLAVAFDPDRLAVSGSPVPVIEDVAVLPAAGLAAFDVSPTGTLAYIPASSFALKTLPVWVDRAGKEQPILSKPGGYFEPRGSPDGHRIAVIYQQAGTRPDVWIYEAGHDVFTRLTFGDIDVSPLWTPDGRRIIYASARPYFDVYWRASDASTAESPLLSDRLDNFPNSVSPDGKTLALSRSGPAGGEIWLLSLDGSGVARQFLKSDFSLRRPAFSPDARWLAFDSDESGKREVYVQSYPDPAKARHQVSIGGGTEPLWTRRGSELVYRNADSVLASTFDVATGQSGRPVTLFSGAFVPAIGAGRGWDAAADGSRFLFIKRPPDEAPRRMTVVLNWFSELGRRMGTPR